LERVPIAYIIGEQDFYGRRFLVNPSVLIPRPETELLVEKAVVFGQELIDSNSSLTIMDLGTGSGVIAITLAKILKLAKVFALDLSLAALRTARNNAKLHGISGQVEFIASDWLSAFAPKRGFDIIIANPPYVAENIKKDLQEELNFEPAGALFSGADGTNALKIIIGEAGQYLAPGGLLLSEIGYDQKDFVLDYVRHLGMFADCAVGDDYAGLPRILQARRRS
jgi:release factor glutamine methyltransferase